MPFDNFVTGAIAKELDSALPMGKVERVYQPGRYEILLHINVPPREQSEGGGSREADDGAAAPDALAAPVASGAIDAPGAPAVLPRKRYDLLISAQGSHPYLYISEKRSGNPQNPPAFCMFLRKHLIGARVERVFRVGRERIIRIEFDATDEIGLHNKRTLLFEIMGKHSNIMLLDENEKVLDAIKRVYPDMSRVRQTLPGVDYTAPPPGKGVGPLMESENETGKPLSYYEGLDAEGRYEPSIFLDEGGRMKDYYVFGIELYGGLGRVRCPSVSAMLESYYEEKDSGNRLEQKCAGLRQALKGSLDKLYLKKQRLLEDIEKAKRADSYRFKGELITANIYRLKTGMKEAELENFETGTEVVRIALDPMLTPAQNAQRYFKKYSKFKTALTEKAKQLDIAERDITFLESYKVFMENAADDADVDGLREELTDLGYMKRRSGKHAKRSVKKEYLRYESSSGLAIYVGRSGRENDELTLKKAKPDDLWLHTKNIPGSHVILTKPAGPAAAKGAHADGVPPGFDEISVREAACIAAYYSKAKQSESVPVDYCLVRYVKKPSGAKPGMVIFTHNRTVYVTPGLPGS
ncbi:MAG: NFACT family protein [Clostridiales Family XIII bacterium]|jgi:predicted ribosome quality control (RQC) complex YloA/Tae2 family protein|nr:NFACT family protein [Clostridiales Family XIII bacterium]